MVLIQSLCAPVFGESAGSAWAPDREIVAPEPMREFRGVWLATVYNLDWPSKPGLPAGVQKEELIEIFDRLASLNINAVILQVRTMCDAFYDSPIEPWSYYLAGELGKPPEPYYDPLAFAVKEAHARGLELHAWFNPFRATTGLFGESIPKSHISREYPWLIRKVQTHQWLDPSSDFVRDRVVTVIFDVVNRYDIDGVQLDDYFYPYPSQNSDFSFEDAENWDRYRLTEGLRTESQVTREDWRRDIVNQLIRRIYTEIKKARPSVKFGVSPFGIWRPGHPEGITGLDSFREIYADSRMWIREGWLDYFAPQLYWKSEGAQNFETLYRWWQEQNLHGRHLWPGIAASRIGKDGEGDGREAKDVLAQIRFTREHRDNSPASGHLLWRWEAFATNRGGIAREITGQMYDGKAIPPPSPWLKDPDEKIDPAEGPPKAGDLRVEKTRGETNGEEKAAWKLTWKPEGGLRTRARWWVVQVRRGEGKWSTERMLPIGEDSLETTDFADVRAVSIRPLDKFGELGEARAFARPPGDDPPENPPDTETADERGESGKE